MAAASDWEQPGPEQVAALALVAEVEAPVAVRGLVAVEPVQAPRRRPVRWPWWRPSSAVALAAAAKTDVVSAGAGVRAGARADAHAARVRPDRAGP